MRFTCILAFFAISVSFLSITLAFSKTFPVDTDASCFTAMCHNGFGKKKFLHEPASEGDECTSCHEAVKEGSHSFQLAAEGKELCFQCHEEEKFQGKAVHEPVSEGECTSCHSPHQSDNPKQLLAPPNKEICFQCHEEEGFEGKTVHGPVAEGKCISCHSPHASNNPKQLLKPVPELCFTCHNVPRKDASGKKIPPISPLFYNKGGKLHMPFKEGKCLSCHFPHGSNNHRLLVREYPSNFYSAYSEKAYSLCLECHGKMKKVLREPNTETDTDFRNGDLNLHYRHVSRIKGRTCRACHHHHGSSNEKLIREEFQFGERMLQLQYEKLDKGARCAPVCHMKVEYDRENPKAIIMKTSPIK
jgi:predicted CXXCH cytochrome family protein